MSSAAHDGGVSPLRSAISFGAQHVLDPPQPSASWLWPPILALVAQALHPNSVFTCKSVYHCSFPHDSHLFDLATKKCLSGTYCWAPSQCSLRMGASPQNIQITHIWSSHSLSTHPLTSFHKESSCTLPQHTTSHALFTSPSPRRAKESSSLGRPLTPHSYRHIDT